MKRTLDSKARRLLAWQAGETPGPWEIILFPTNRCNLKCRICWQRWVEEEKGKVDLESEVSDERLLRLVDEAADLDVREWNIVGGGEPMVRGPLVMQMCERIRELGMNGTIQTNGTRFTGEQFETLIQIGWEKIVVSLDGPSAEINDAIRSERSFDQATKNLRTLKDLKYKHDSVSPRVGLSMVITNANYDRIEDMLYLGRDLGCETVGGITLVAQSTLCQDFVLTEAQYAKLQENIRRAELLAKEIGVQAVFCVPDKPMSEWPECAPVVSSDPSDIVNAVCFEPWLTLAVLAEGGRGGPCAPSWDMNCDTINDLSLRELWTGPYLQEVRQQILAHTNLPDYCHTCCSNIPGQTARIREQVLNEQYRHKGIASKLRHNIKTQGLWWTIVRVSEWLRTRNHPFRKR